MQITTVGKLAGHTELWSTMFHADVDIGTLATGKKLRTAELVEVFDSHHSKQLRYYAPVFNARLQLSCSLDGFCWYRPSLANSGTNTSETPSFFC